MRGDESGWSTLGLGITVLVVAISSRLPDKVEPVKAYIADCGPHGCKNVRRESYIGVPASQQVLVISEGAVMKLDDCVVGTFKDWSCYDGTIRTLMIDGELSFNSPYPMLTPISWWRWYLNKSLEQSEAAK